MILLEALEQTRRETMEAFGTDEGRLDLTYGVGKWTVREILHHLSDAETVLFDRIRRVISEPRQVIWAFDQDAWATGLGYPERPLRLSSAAPRATERRRSLRVAVLTCLLSWSCTSVPAPAPGTPVIPDRECQSLDQLLGPSQPEPQMARPLWRLRACPEQAGAALARAIESMGSVSDTVELERRTWLTHYVVDDRIVAAASGVAGGLASSPEARVYALRTLIWQKAPGQLLTVATLTDGPPPARALSISSSYTNHYYTDLGYGSGENPWPVLGRIPGDDYVARLSRVVTDMQIPSGDERVRNARAWFLWYEQDAQLARLLEAAREGAR